MVKEHIQDDIGTAWGGTLGVVLRRLLGCPGAAGLPVVLYEPSGEGRWRLKERIIPKKALPIWGECMFKKKIWGKKRTGKGRRN